MTETEQDDIDSKAAEYALGTLEAMERAALNDRRSREPKLDAAITDWERRLSPLLTAAQPMAPPAGLRDIVAQRISRVAERGADVIALQRQVTRWKRVSSVAMAAAACLAVAIGLRETAFAPGSRSFVAVFHKDDAQPAFLLAIDLASRELTIRPLTADNQPGKTYQLWILSDQIGPAPRSLGLLETVDQPTRKTLTPYEPALLQRATFGISLEPAGGSTTGRPSPGALHGRLYPATP